LPVRLQIGDTFMIPFIALTGVDKRFGGIHAIESLVKNPTGLRTDARYRLPALFGQDDFCDARVALPLPCLDQTFPLESLHRLGHGEELDDSVLCDEAHAGRLEFRENHQYPPTRNVHSNPLQDGIQLMNVTVIDPDHPVKG